MTFIPSEQVEWRNVKVIKDDWRIHDSPYYFKVTMPEPLASWDVWDYWEKERFLHMRDNLKQGDILFDIGTEQGWTNIIYAQFCGPENIVLFEPTKEFWANIKETWQKNYDVPPLACWQGLVGDKTTSRKILDKHTYPECANSGLLIDKNKYQYIHENDGGIEQIRLDDYIEMSGIIPTAITMDIEGAELLALQGAEQTLKNNNIKLWVSIHDDLAEKDYAVKPGEVIEYLRDLGYHDLKLAVDHEAHYYFWKV